MIGSSIYYGLNTNSNRPEDDLDGVDPPLLLVDVHTILQHDRWRGSGVVIYGYLWYADEISERNARLPNNSEALRTAVSDNALAAWGELGYNINTYVGLDYLHRLEPFARVDYYDTMYNSRKHCLIIRGLKEPFSPEDYHIHSQILYLLSLITDKV